MKSTLKFALLACIVPFLSASVKAEDAIKVLIMTGQNNHDWKTTTPMMLKLYEAGGKFDVTVNEAPWDLKPDAFAKYDVIVSNWSVWPKVELDPWSDEVKKAFLDFVNKGGGLMVMHAGSSIHYQWPEFQKIIGATWMKGVTGHGPRHEFEVEIKDPNHPITKGMKPFYLFDELWQKMVRPEGLEVGVLASAFASKEKRGTGKDEPMVMTTSYGKGRGVNLVLGHNTQSMSYPGFQELFLRCTEWAATGDVKKPYNVNVPAPVVREAKKPAQKSR